MASRNSLFLSSLFCLSVTGSVLIMAGCSKNDSTSEPSPSSSASKVASSDSPEGMFQSAGCVNCHSVGSGGGGRKKDLSHIGGEHDAAWIASYIESPQSVKPGSRMPAFKGKLADADIQSLSKYLASLK